MADGLMVRLGEIFLLSAAASGLVTWIVIRWARRLGIIDDPRTHPLPKVVHGYPVPRGGGWPILLALIVGLITFLPSSPVILSLVTGALLLTLISYLDDLVPEGISPWVRLGINVLVAILMVWSGIRITYITNPLGGIWRFDQYWWLPVGITMMWLVGMQNIVGWSSGVDGQLPGFVIIAAIVVGILGLRFTGDRAQISVVILAAIVAGAYAGFLPWNWYPQKIMPGYGGKSLAGLLLGVLAILSGGKVGTMLMVLGLPFIDAVLVLIKRARERRSLFQGGYEHFHHYLLQLGWGKRRIAIFYWLLSAALGFLALQLNSSSKYFTMATIFLGLGGVILWFHYFSIYSKRPGPGNGSKT